MSLDLLDTPLRATWHLDALEGALCEKEVRQLATRLGDAGLFHLTLEGMPLAHAATPDAIALLVEAGVQVACVYGGSAEEATRLQAGLPLTQIWLDAGSFVERQAVRLDGLEQELSRLRQAGYDPALLLVPMRRNIGRLTELFDFCRRLQVGKFKLPNTPIDGSFCSARQDDLLRPEDLETLREQLGENAADKRRGVSLQVHDRFLWELLCEAEQNEHSEYGGCQAGNSLAHIDRSGNVLPCSSWPESLGNLLEKDLDAIWALPGRLAVRQEIEVSPAGCLGCRDYHLCFGACRGLGRTVNSQHGDRDPICAGPRRQD